MNLVEFTKKYKDIINAIADSVELADKDDSSDIDIQSDVLTITNSYGTFVVNKQEFVQEIWLSSPISGPYHFFYKDGKWQNKNNVELFSLLESELKIVIQHSDN